MAADVLDVEQFAELIGVSRRRVFQMAHEANPPPVDEAGKYPCKDTGAWFRQRILGEIGVSSTGETYDLNAEKARWTYHQANISAIEEEIKRKNVIPADAVQSHWEGMVANTRAKLLNLPGRLATKVVGAATIQDAEREARDLIHEALMELSENGVP